MTAYTLAAADAAYIQATNAAGVSLSQRRHTFPEAWVSCQPGDPVLALKQSKQPFLIETRQTFVMGTWRLFWTSGRGGWAVRIPRNLAEELEPAFATFRGGDASTCRHPRQTWVESSSTYRTATCPDCGAVSTLDSSG